MVNSGMPTEEVIKALGDEAERLADESVDRYSSRLEEIMIPALVGIYIAGANQLDKEVGAAIPPVTNSEASRWARAHAGELIKDLNETSRQALRKTISDGIREGKKITHLRRDIQSEFRFMVKTRADRIARTETANALGNSFMERGRQLNIKGKKWLASWNSCPICMENQAAGVIPFEDSFPSGHSTPPSHPNCTCAVAPAKLRR